MARVQRTKVLRVGAVAGAVPYFNKDLVSGKWEGFGPRLRRKPWQRSLGAKVETVETTWGNAVLDVQTNKIDAMFGMAPTPARKEVVNFSDTLFDNTYTAVCKAGVAPKTWEQLNVPDAKVVVDVGSSHDQLATKILPKANVTRLENSGAATLSLQTGRSDCQILVILLGRAAARQAAGPGHDVHPDAGADRAPVSIGIPQGGRRLVPEGRQCLARRLPRQGRGARRHRQQHGKAGRCEGRGVPARNQVLNRS